MLTNGLDLRRKATSSTWDTDGRGLSFISDNPVYVLGDFNAHTSASNTTAASLTNGIEEFTDTPLIQTGSSPSWTASTFYSRSNLNTNFARASTDSWRPSSIVADAISILSSSFVPGYIDRGILWNSTTSTLNSYGGMHILRNNATSNASSTEMGSTKAWWREDGTAPAAGTTTNAIPIKISRRGLPIYSNLGSPAQPVEYGFVTTPSTSAEYWEAPSVGPVSGTVYGVTARINAASNTSLNTVLVSGISPARATQDTGGLINFIRQIENWSKIGRAHV